MQFSYTAKNKEGVVQSGSMEAADRFALARALRTQGLIPVSVKDTKQTGLSINIPFLEPKVTLREKILFTKNMSGMLRAGLSLVRALQVLNKQTTNKTFKKVLDSVEKDIVGGSTLSDSMKKFPKVFSELFVAMVSAGEESGDMSGALEQVGISIEKTYALNARIKSALMYPMIILSAIFLIGILMFVFVVPTITKTFKDLGVDLPASTKFVVWLSDTMSSHPLLLLLFLIVVGSGIAALLRSKSAQPKIDTFILKLPVISNLVRETNTARTTRTISSLLGSGVDIVHTLTITHEVLQNHLYKEVLNEAIESVQKGGQLSVVFKKYPKLFPIMMSEMIAVGEETGKLSNMLSDVAVFYEGEVDTKTKDLSTIIEPVLMVFIGAAVGFFAISMLSPMYSLMDTVK